MSYYNFHYNTSLPLSLSFSSSLPNFSPFRQVFKTNADSQRLCAHSSSNAQPIEMSLSAPLTPNWEIANRQDFIHCMEEHRKSTK